MSRTDSAKHKPGRKPSGRTTVPVNVRMETTIKQRLVEHSSRTRRPQIAFIEEGLEKVLPPVTNA